MHTKNFQEIVWQFYRINRREMLPWRKKITPYRILVSEVMLQQTQVERVIPFFETWMLAFPTMDKLARAPQDRVLRLWKGLGYNSRALRLHQLAKVITRDFKGTLPKEKGILKELPGIGPYTAGALLAFAWNEPSVFIETNIRTVFLYHFFQDQKQVTDTEILELIRKTLPGTTPREWYWALMDYGAHLKKQGVQLNAKSKQYTKQSKFKGSDRQIRGKILGMLLKEKSLLYTEIKKRLPTALATRSGRLTRILQDLYKEGFIVYKNKKYLLKK